LGLHYRFGRFELLPGERQLLDAGQPAALGSRAFDVLNALVEQRDRVVAKEELMARAWPGMVVEDNNLTVQISALRKLLGADAIATVAGRGYQFALPLAPHEMQAAALPQPLSASAPALPDKPSVAVLAFANLSANPQDEYFCDGVTEDIITELSRFHSLFVISRNSSFTYKGKAVDVRAVARELGVRYVLEGSVRRAGERVRVTAQLIDAATGGHIWAEKYDRVMDDVFEVQEEVTRSIVSAIAPQVESSENAKTHQSRPADLSAYEIGLRAWATLQTVTSEAMRPARLEALRLARNALAADPRSALAMRTIAMAQYQEIFFGAADSVDAATEETLRVTTAAIDIDNTDHHAHLWKGMVQFLIGRFEAGLVDLRRARELNPNDAVTAALLGFCEALMGQTERGIRLTTEALRLSPRDPQRPLLLNVLAWANFAAGDYARAAEAAQLSASERPGFPPPLMCLAVCHAAMGEIDKAKAAYRIAYDSAPEFVSGRLGGFKQGNDSYRGRATRFLRMAAGLDPATPAGSTPAG
jgi:TolB-like protein/Flp pilus assembly protein TadD